LVGQWIFGALLLAQAAAAAPAERVGVTMDGKEIAAIERSEYELPLLGSPFINEIKYQALTDKLARQYDREPVNAKLDGAGRIVPESTGYRLDRRAFFDRFHSFFVDGKGGSFELPLRAAYPRVDSELLSVLKEKTIGQYTTYYNSNNKSRSNNIDLASRAIDNRYVFPGERFSFNSTVGERTALKGYKRAKVIVRGEVAEGIGGGICQISSTLFNAVDRAGMKIVQRYSHSRNVTYVPPGRDATVSWYGPDFVFENPYDHPVLIRSFAGAGAITVLIYSSEEIHNRPREVPSASKKLPEEVPANRYDAPFIPGAGLSGP